MKKKEPSYTLGGNVNWCSRYGEQLGGPLKSKIELPYDPEIPPLDIYLKKVKALIRKDTCNSMFIAALFIIAMETIRTIYKRHGKDQSAYQQTMGLRRYGMYIHRQWNITQP